MGERGREGRELSPDFVVLGEFLLGLHDVLEIQQHRLNAEESRRARREEKRERRERGKYLHSHPLGFVVREEFAVWLR